MDTTLIAATVAAVAGILGGMASAWFVHWLNREQYQVNIAKTKQEMEQTGIEIEKLRANVQAAVSFQGTTTDVVTLYDSTRGFGGFDFGTDSWAGAEGGLKVIDDDIKNGVLSLERSNTDGAVRVVLKSYSVKGSSVPILPPGPAGAKRRLRAELQARTLGAERSIHLIIKDPKSGPGVHLADWRERLVSETWKPIQAYFEFTAGNDVLFRIDDRSVTNAPSTLQIRRLVLTERRN